MNILSILITAVGLSMDAFAVSITNGMCTRYLRFRDALKMALSFGIFPGAHAGHRVLCRHHLQR